MFLNYYRVHKIDIIIIYITLIYLFICYYNNTSNYELTINVFIK